MKIREGWLFFGFSELCVCYSIFRFNAQILKLFSHLDVVYFIAKSEKLSSNIWESYMLRTIFFVMILSVTLVNVGLSFTFLPKGYQYVSPTPNTTRVPLESTIIFRFNDNNVITGYPLVQVKGSKSGMVKGELKQASDGETFIFMPNHKFQENEIVKVTISPHQENFPSYSYSFRTLLKTEIAESVKAEWEQITSSDPTLSKLKTTVGAQIMPNGVSVPDDFPHVRVSVNKETADGYIFINNWRDDAPYNIIFDNDGSPVWYERQVRGDRRRDFKLQKNGTISMLTRSGGERHLNYDINFNLIGEYSPADPYSSDEHEFQILEDGGYLMLGRRNLDLDWSDVVPGGRTNIEVRETTLQEFTADGELIFNWPALEHFDPNDVFDYCERNEADPTSNFIRFPHMNSIDIDYDGHILLSSRHISEVTKINRQTGEIIWRLGGANNQFEFVNDRLGGFYMQHDFRSVGDNHYTLFDNGNLHSPKQSRAVEYVLDTDKMTATLVWEFPGPDDKNYYTRYMGNAQRLPNGNTLINFVEENNPKAIEVTQEGEVVFEMNFVDGYDTYRTFRFPWAGVVETPRLYLEQDGDGVTLIFNKFGDENVAYYNIYSGTRPNPTTLLDTSKATLKTVKNLENEARNYFRVTAVATDGSESGYSNEVDVYYKVIEPGTNIISNGNFDSDLDAWNFSAWGANAEATVTDEGECHIEINRGGNGSWGIQLNQGNLPLTRGKIYSFEFDAYASDNRTIEAQVIKPGFPPVNYSRTGTIAIRRAKQQYSFEFTMNQPSDPNAIVAFYCGGDNEDVFIDNVSLKEVVDTNIAEIDNHHPEAYQLYPAFPNPFNPSTTISYRIPENADIKLYIYNIRGERILELVNGNQTAGEYQIDFDGSHWGSGVYFYELNAKSLSGYSSYHSVEKMTLVK